MPNSHFSIAWSIAIEHQFHQLLAPISHSLSLSPSISIVEMNRRKRGIWIVNHIKMTSINAITCHNDQNYLNKYTLNVLFYFIYIIACVCVCFCLLSLIMADLFKEFCLLSFFDLNLNLFKLFTFLAHNVWLRVESRVHKHASIEVQF